MGGFMDDRSHSRARSSTYLAVRFLLDKLELTVLQSKLYKVWYTLQIVFVALPKCRLEEGFRLWVISFPWSVPYD